MSAAFTDRARASSPEQAVPAVACERGAAACPVDQLHEALARVEVLLREKDELIQQQGNLRREADHRFLNDLQMVASLLSMQARASINAETSAQLAIAATPQSGAFTIGCIPSTADKAFPSGSSFNTGGSS